MNDMEKNQVSESEDFAAMLEETMVKFRPGQVVKGVVAQVSDDGVVVSIPGKADGFIKKNDLVTTDCKVDDEIEAEGYTIEDIPETDDDDFGFMSDDDYSEEDE